MSMISFDCLYKQYRSLTEKAKSEAPADDLTTNLLQYGITREYFDKVDNATGLLLNFYDKYLTRYGVCQAVYKRVGDDCAENVKFCMLVDVLRCYDGLDHPTSFTTPEGIVFMMLLGRILGVCEISSYSQLAAVDSARLSLIDIIPYIDMCSEELGNRYSLFMSTIFEDIDAMDIDRLYRMLLYNLCKSIAEVDGVISPAEQDWLNEIALLNDDDPNNDIDVSGL